MMLLVDIGNTSLKWATLKQDKIMEDFSIAVSEPVLTSILTHEWGAMDRPNKVIVANVVGDEMAQELEQWTSAKWGLRPVFIRSPKQGFGVVNAYVQPENLGVDRWCTLVAVHRLFSGAACIIDCGTALTIDVLDNNGAHLGGLIVPGLTLMRTSLVENTHIKIDNDKQGSISLLARDTSDAIAGGSLYSLVAFIDRVVADVTKELGLSMTCVLTGGDAQRLLPLLQGKFEYVPNLVLQGLAVMSKEIA